MPTTKPEKFEASELLKTHVPFADMIGLVNQMKRQATVMSWGAHAWTRENANCLRFMVHGHHHTGHIFIAPNPADLFDVFIVTTRGTLRKKLEDIFVEDLISVIDEAVERIDEYKQ